MGRSWDTWRRAHFSRPSIAFPIGFECVGELGCGEDPWFCSARIHLVGPWNGLA